MEFAKGGSKALSCLATAPFDVVLTDMRMPGMDGAQTLAGIRALGIGAPAVLVSAVLDVERVAARHGFDAALPKPLSSDDLIGVMRRLLG